jgi:multidrug efflux system membrane fusion protein
VTVRAQIDGRLLEVAFREGQNVKAGDVLARIDPAPLQAALDQALARLAQNEATLANARLDLDRYERLAATNAGPRQQADQQRALVAQLQAQVRADQAAVDAARINLGYTTLTAPIDGRAGLRQADAGNIIRAGDATGLVTVAQIQPIAVLFTLPQRDLGVTRQAMAAGRVPVEALDTDGRTVLGSGALEVIDNQVDQATGTIRLKAAFPNADLALWPGQFVTVRVRVAELTNAVVVPTPALRRGPSGLFVYRIEADGKARVRPVASTQQDEAIAVIESGLSAGETVVTAGFQRLTDGKAVTIAPEPGVAPPGEPPRTSGQQRERRGS